MTIGDNIRRLRESSNLTQADIARRVHVSSQVASNWERNYSVPNAYDIARLSELFNISADSVLDCSQEDGTFISSDIAESIKVVGREIISLMADVVKGGLSEEQLIELLKMIGNLRNQNLKSP